MVWPLIIGTAASVAGAAISSKGAKDAAAKAAAGSDKEIAYNRESRDIARGDLAPYRTAGYAALDRAGEMTGLLDPGGTFGPPGGEYGSSENAGAWGASPWSMSQEGDQYIATLPDGTKSYWDGQNWQSSRGSAYGGGGSAIQQRATGGMLYNVNELGPESVYSGGSYTRSAMPRTMPPDPTGYVKPTGRAIGGSIPEVHTVGMSDPNAGAVVGGKPPHTRIPGPVTPGPVNDQPAGRNMLDMAREQGYTGDGNDLGGWLSNRGMGTYQNFATGPNSGESKREGYMNETLANNPGSYRMGEPDPRLEGTPGGAGTAVGGTSSDGVTPRHESGGPAENPYDFTTDPGYNFRFDEGMRALSRGGAAAGGLLSGGFARKAIRYGQDYASGEFSNIYNRIAGIAGIGGSASTASGSAAVGTGGAMGRAAGEGGLSSAYGDMGATNAWAGAANDIARLPWGDVFGGGGNTKPQRDFQGRVIQYD